MSIYSKACKVVSTKLRYSDKLNQSMESELDNYDFLYFRIIA